MDNSVAPGDDFNAYTNGGWIKATPIPADKSNYGSGAILADETRKRDAFPDSGCGEGQQAAGDANKIGDFFCEASWTKARLSRKGITPLQPEIGRVCGNQR